MNRKFNSNTKKISRKQKSSEIIAGFLFSLGFIIFLLAVVSFIYFTIQKNIQFRTDFEQFDEIDTMQMKVKANASRLEAHMVHVSNAQMIERYLETSDKDLKSDIEEFFIKVIEYNTRPQLPTLNQMRIIDIHGMEKIRVDLGKNNEAFIVDDDKLQNKSNRYYFRESLKLDPQSIYISPLDLNVENGRIEYPLNPVLRVSKAIFDESGNKLGFLILNQLYTSVFSEIEKLNKHEGDLLFLLNSKGYYLYGPDPLQSYSFMFEDSVDYGFFSDYPDIWKEIRISETRKFTFPEGIIYVRDFNPNEQSVFEPSASMTWYLIMLVPYENYNNENNLLNRAIIMGLLFISPFLILIGSVMGRSLVKNRFYMKSLERSATHDDMTGLLNHQAVMERLDYLIHLTTRQESSLCVAFIDLNDLKRINDTLGHEKGDLLIIAMSQSIINVARNTDVASRIGGDEFIIFFPDLSMENSRLVLKRIKEEFGNRGKTLFGWETHFSWGISQWDLNNDTPEQFIARADKAMYLMKNKMKRKGV